MTPSTADTTTPATGSRLGARIEPGQGLPRANSSSTGVAPMQNNYYQLLQIVLFWAGAILLPTGLIVIVLGWYGAANTPYQYDQISYLVSGGLLGLGLTFAGGFLYFGAWLARLADDQRQASKRLSDTLLVLADITSRAARTDDSGVDVGAIPVVAGKGTVMHRRDCSLIAHREDLKPVGEKNDHLAPCRVCRPVG